MTTIARTFNTVRSFLNDPSACTQPDAVLSAIVDVLFDDPSPIEPNDVCIKDACIDAYIIIDALGLLAPFTWYRCSCSTVSPLQGNVDAVCPRCASLRTLPTRLSFPLWTASVLAMRRAFPTDWFERLARWTCSQHMASINTDSPVRRLDFIDGMSVTSDGRTLGTNWIALPLPASADLKNY